MFPSSFILYASMMGSGNGSCAVRIDPMMLDCSVLCIVEGKEMSRSESNRTVNLTEEKLASVRFANLYQSRLNRAQYWRFFVNLILMLCDGAVFVVCGVAVLFVRSQENIYIGSEFGFVVNPFGYLVIASVLIVYCLRSAGVYHRHVMGDGYQLNMLLFKGSVQGWVALCALNFILLLDLPLSTLTLIVSLNWVCTICERIVVRAFITRGRRKGAYSYGTVVVGSPAGIGRTLRFLYRRKQLNYRPIAVCPIRLNAEGRVIAETDIKEIRHHLAANGGASLKILRYEDTLLAERMVAYGAQTVMVSDVLHRFSDNFNAFSVRMESLGMEIALITSAADTGGHETMVRSIQGVTVLTLQLPQYTPHVRFMKRMFDLVISSVAVLVSLIITIPVAIAIKLTDGGPVFYTQERIGLRGRPFRMIKFRSMVVNADELKAELAQETGQEDRFIFKMKDDPRVTKVGKFIRRFSIDELPQFLNVLKGDMSVVGPRPPLPEEYARYNPLYATRMLVKPGITGPWQVSGRSDLSAEESEALDVSYVQNWSILGDVVLIFRTVGAVLSHKGAY